MDARIAVIVAALAVGYFALIVPMSRADEQNAGEIDRTDVPPPPEVTDAHCGCSTDESCGPQCQGCLPDAWTEDFLSASVGSEVRYRYMDEQNRLRPPGPGRSTYDLWRWRPWVELKFQDWLAVRFDGIDAASFNEDLPPLAIDENRSDVLQAYVDWTLAEPAGRPVKLRVGRQLLSLGSQYLVSALPWANTFRNFEGFRLSSPGEVLDLDAFVMRPVNGPPFGIVRPRSADQADFSRTFSGVYASYHGLEHNTFDVYWFWLREQEPLASRMDGSRHTVGVRWLGSHREGVGRLWSWELEGAYQFGHDNNLFGVEQTVQAGFLTATAGHTWNQTPWTPTIKALYYWGSGDDDPVGGNLHTFSSLFPFSHTYWGILDNFSGENLINYSVQGSVQPGEALTLDVAMHWFNAAAGRDRIYNVAGVALGPGGTGSDYGQELDVIATFTVLEDLTLQLGQSWFWYGGAVTSGPLMRDDATQFYVMTTYRY